MPNRQWGVGVALGLFLVAFLSFGFGAYVTALNYPQEQRYQPYRYAADKPREIDLTAAEGANAEAFEYRTPCQDPKGRDESDLCAQWRAAKAAENSAFWTKWAFWVGLGTIIGLIYTLILSRRTTQATIDTLEIQITASRPLMNLSGVEARQGDQRRDGQLEMRCGWTFKNFGLTGCWLEEIWACVDDCIDSDNNIKRHPVNAFVAPGGTIFHSANNSTIIFDQEEAKRVADTKSMILIGHVAYRDSGGRRWKTGFAVSVSLDDGFIGTGFGPVGNDSHWFDERIDF